MAGIKHSFVSYVSDDGDSSLVRPSNWNAEHIIEDSSIAESKLALTDNTTANASVSMHGLLPKLPGSNVSFLRGDGTWNDIGYGTIVFGWNNGASAITACDQEISLPVDGTIIAWTVLADKTANISIDLWVDSYANYPPTVDDSICNSSYVTLSSANKNMDSIEIESAPILNWVRAFDAGSTMIAHIRSVSLASRITLIIEYVKGTV